MEFTRARAPWLVGRADEALAGHFPPRPREELVQDDLWHGNHEGESCRVELLQHVGRFGVQVRADAARLDQGDAGPLLPDLRWLSLIPSLATLVA